MVENLKKLRNSFGISQQALANAIGTSQQSINKYENHSVEPDIATLIALADYFNVSVDFLIGRVSSDNSSPDTEEALLIKNYRCLDEKEKFCTNTLIKSFISAKSSQ